MFKRKKPIGKHPDEKIAGATMHQAETNYSKIIKKSSNGKKGK
jgi:hypothetical protein